MSLSVYNTLSRKYRSTNCSEVSTKRMWRPDVLAIIQTSLFTLWLFIIQSVVTLYCWVIFRKFEDNQRHSFMFRNWIFIWNGMWTCMSGDIFSLWHEGAILVLSQWTSSMKFTFSMTSTLLFAGSWYSCTCNCLKMAHYVQHIPVL
jgi:hypothetical protein